ncbi:MAG TPA: hypothetical protein VIJ18_04905 [Microbacteriaceae bacterium]
MSNPDHPEKGSDLDLTSEPGDTEEIQAEPGSGPGALPEEGEAATVEPGSGPGAPQR